jgi:hypothetical protein
MNWISYLFYSGCCIGSALLLLQNSEDAKQLKRVQELQGGECVSLKNKIIKFSRYIFIITSAWHHGNILCDTFLLSHSPLRIASSRPNFFRY